MISLRIPCTLQLQCRRLPSSSSRLSQPRQMGLICRAASGRPEDRSWAEYASEAAELARGVLSKAASGLQEGMGKILPPSSDDATSRAAPIEQEDTGWGGKRPGGILRQGDGSLVGGLLGMALKGIMGAVGKELQAASQQSAAVQTRAAAIIESDMHVRNALGGGAVLVSPDPLSQSSSSIIINGQRSTAVTLLLQLRSSTLWPTGATATAEVRFQQNPALENEDTALQIAVRTNDGRVINVAKAGSESIIDVDWQEVK